MYEALGLTSSLLFKTEIGSGTGVDGSCGFASRM